MKYFDMMYYYLATVYQKFSKTRSVWESQVIGIISITQTAFILDLYLLYNKLQSISGKFSIFEKLFFFSLILILLYYNSKRYEKKFLHFKSIWGVHEGIKKKLFIFLSFFTVIFAWCFILIIGYIFNRY